MCSTLGIVGAIDFTMYELIFSGELDIICADQKKWTNLS